MITVHPSRGRPQDRIPTESQKPTAQQMLTLKAPVAGWVTNENMAEQRPDSAFVMDNVFPTAYGVEGRGGFQAHVDVAGTVAFLFEFSAAEEFIVADESAIYKFTDATVGGTTLSSVVTGLSNGNWQAVETQNDAGSFLTMVNGTDNLILYDQTTWYTVTGVSATHAITGGLDTADISYVWNYRNRTWFVEQNTMNAWYLGVNSVSGAATRFPLAGVFRKGGTLHSGATFSSDSGDGLDDRILFMTTRGEFAIYANDPASGFSLIGVYDIGEPLAKSPYIRIGGDLLVVTKSGLIPVSGAIQKGPGELKVTSASLPIEPDWEFWVIAWPTGWNVTTRPAKSQALISVPNDENPFFFVLNLETGAWARWTNIKATAAAELGDNLYFANGSDVFLADAGGNDNGSPYTMQVCTSFLSLGEPSAHKSPKRVRGKFRRNITFMPQFSIASDYNPSFPTAPTASTGTSVVSGAVWDIADWDVTDWGNLDRSKTVQAKWQVVNGAGFAHAVQFQVVSSSEAKLDFEWIAHDVTFVAGDT